MAILNAGSIVGGKEIETTEGSQAKVDNHASETDVHGLGDAKVEIGLDASAGTGAVAVGRYSRAFGGSSLALGSGASVDGHSSVAIGVDTYTPNSNQGVFGSEESGGLDWNFVGTLSASGAKNFVIPHPHPDKRYTHKLRHSAVESPTAGDNLYRFEIEATEANETVEMELPDYFQYLNKDVECWVNGVKHFGSAYADVEGNTLKVTCETAGKYRILVLGTRNDNHLSIQDWDIKGVERENGESWTGETYIFEVPELIEVDEFKEVE